ncbi:MAG: prolyl oligopeptidase family serine peptidase [Candidatus Diapherotrites archaeon]|nr:prolyl oligopeptidase family serine peptidase [Candidatus Diapherotrites archaeon]
MDTTINGLECSIHEPETYKSIIIMCNGFNAPKDSPHRIRIANYLFQHNYRIVRWDYRSRTTGKPTKTLTEDLNDLLLLINHFDASGIYGSSWGGLLALHAASRNKNIRAIVLRVPVIEPNHFKNNPELLNNPLLAENFLEDFLSYNTYRDSLKRKFATLLFAGKHDDICPLEYAKRLFSLLPQPKKLIVLDEGHQWSEQSYTTLSEESIKWFNTYLSKTSSNFR